MASFFVFFSVFPPVVFSSLVVLEECSTIPARIVVHTVDGKCLSCSYGDARQYGWPHHNYIVRGNS